MTCLNPGTANPDISGLGILISFDIQAGISLILSIVSFAFRDAATTSQRQILKHGFRKEHIKERWGQNVAEDTNEEELGQVEKKRRATRKVIDRILAGASDVQTLNGIALLIAALIQWKTLNLYHFHTVYDTASFVGVSFVAALTNVFGFGDERRTSRYISIAIFGVLFLVFTILFGISLNKWDDNSPGRCYNGRVIAAPGSDHPLVDSIYIGFTCFCLLTTLGSALEHSVGTAKENVFRRFSVIQLSAIQYPIHLYMVITMREENASLLEDNSENEWGFAQIVALVLLASTLVECARGAKDIWFITRESCSEGDLEVGDSTSCRPTSSNCFTPHVMNPIVSQARDVTKTD